MYLVTLLFGINVQSEKYKSFALRGYLIKLSPVGNFTDWLNILGNHGQLVDKYGDSIEDDVDIDICDYIRDVFEKRGNNIYIVTCEQKPAIHELHPDEPISITVYLDKKTWDALTDKCEQSPGDLLADELVMNSNEKIELRVTELPDPGKAYGYDIIPLLMVEHECNRTVIDEFDAEFRERVLPHMNVKLLHSKVRCGEGEDRDHIKIRQLYNVSNAGKMLLEFGSLYEDDDLITAFLSFGRFHPYSDTIDDHADLCGGNYKSGISSQNLQNTDKQNKAQSIQQTAMTDESSKTESSQSIRVVVLETLYFSVIVSLHVMRII